MLACYCFIHADGRHVFPGSERKYIISYYSKKQEHQYVCIGSPCFSFSYGRHRGPAGSHAVSRVTRQQHRTWGSTALIANNKQDCSFSGVEALLYHSRCLLQSQPWEMVWARSGQGLAFLVHPIRMCKMLRANGRWPLWIGPLSSGISFWQYLGKEILHIRIFKNNKHVFSCTVMYRYIKLNISSSQMR